MALLDELDLAVKKVYTKGYEVSGRIFDSYMNKDEWERFKFEMQNKYPDVFDSFNEGAGNELEERMVNGNVYPPKMASYASSSRMLYLLSRDITGFRFEKKLCTTVGGTANIDGFADRAEGYIFVEAKFREPYCAKRKLIKKAYSELYSVIDKSNQTPLKCKMSDIKEDMMSVDFSYNSEKIERFDIKQMISHLSGIATALLKRELEPKAIKFIYLLFDPRKINIAESKCKEEINKIYLTTCKECCAIDFSEILLIALKFLRDIKKVGYMSDDEIAGIVKKFEFKLCNQEDYITVV